MSMSESSGMFGEDCQRACDCEEDDCEAALDDDVESCCWSGEGVAGDERCEKVDPPEPLLMRMDVGVVGDRKWCDLRGRSRSRSRSDEYELSGDVARSGYPSMLDAGVSPRLGGGRSGTAGRAWCGSR